MIPDKEGKQNRFRERPNVLVREQWKKNEAAGKTKEEKC